MLTTEEIMSYLGSDGRRPKTAVLSSSDPKTPFYAGMEGTQAFEHPAANILHQMDSIKHPETTALYLSYPPSELELGMIWRAKIPIVYFLKPGLPDKLEIGKYRVTQDGYDLLEYPRLRCHLSDDASKREMETREPRLKIAIDSPICERPLFPQLVVQLKHGLDKMFAIEVAGGKSTKTDEDFIRIVLSMVDRSWNSHDGQMKPLDRVKGNNIGAIMVDENNKIIGWGLNYKGNNKTLHAETMMIQQYLRENNTDKLPTGARIYTSLQCCHMCAGHIATLGENIRVVYAQRDPYFEGQTVIDPYVSSNHCTETPTTLPIHDIFSSQVGAQDILDFLFGLHPADEKKSLPTRELFARTYRDVDLFKELALTVQSRNEQYSLPGELASEKDQTDTSSLGSFDASRPDSPAGRSSNSPVSHLSSSRSSDSPFSNESSSTPTRPRAVSCTVMEAGTLFLDALGEIAPKPSPAKGSNRSRTIRLISPQNDTEPEPPAPDPSLSPRRGGDLKARALYRRRKVG